jgi:energy-converting hydrogenase Eha subunit F
MAVEKQIDVAIESQYPQYDVAQGHVVEQTAASAALGEATGMYGNAATAQELGYVHRG